MSKYNPYVVRIQFSNKTSECLVLHRSGTHTTHGRWENLPDTIPAGDRAAFQLVNAPQKGFEGTLEFTIETDEDDEYDEYDGPLSRVQVRARFPVQGGIRKFLLYPLKPESVYVATLRSWKDNNVVNPECIECTVRYSTNRCRFQLVGIDALTNYHVKNSRDELIAGFHPLWQSDSAADWKDAGHGSYAPNVFAYKLNSLVAEDGGFRVTVRPVDAELVSAEVIVYGSINGIRTIQTERFFIRAMKDEVAHAHVIHPTRSACPFSINADVVWSMELCQSLRGVIADGPHETRLELYWVAAAGPPDLYHSIPIEMLRNAFCASSPDHDVKEKETDISSDTSIDTPTPDAKFPIDQATI